MIDCQNKFSCAAVAADAGTAAPAVEGGCAAETGGEAAGTTAATAGTDPSADRSAAADGPSRYPVGRAPRADCQCRIAARVRGPNRPSAPPGSKPAACSPCWIRRRAARSRFSPLFDHRAVAAPGPNDAARPAAAGTALIQRRLPRPGRRVVRFCPAHRRAVGVLVGRVGRAPAERQHDRASRAALPQRPSLRGGGRRLVVHGPAPLVALAFIERQRALRRLRAGKTLPCTRLPHTTSNDHRLVFIVCLSSCSRTR